MLRVDYVTYGTFYVSYLMCVITVVINWILCHRFNTLVCAYDL